jgi:predicted Zn-dependent protease
VLAEAHAGLDENQPAEQAYKQAIKRRPTETAYKLALAEHYRRLGNLLGAQRYFQAALENEPGNGAALEGLIDCYLRSGKVELARAQLERVNRDTVPQDTLRRVDTLMRFLSAPFGSEHLAELQSQFQQHPDDTATARLLAGGLYVSGRLDEACAVIEKARALRPDDYHFAILLANVHAMRGEFEKAIALLQNLAERFPNRLMVLEPLALWCVYDFRFEEGRPVLQRLIELEEDEDQRSEYREKLRDSFLIFGELDEALHLVEGWVKAEPKNDRLLLHKVIVLIYADRNEEACALLEECLARNPNDLDWQDRYYRSARATQQYERVLKRIREWLDAEPSSATYTEWLIDVLIWADRADEALEVARKFEGTYVESVNRRIWLGRCQAAKGEVSKALAEFDALLSERLTEGSQRREVWKQIAITLLAAERFDEALQRCDQWLEQAEDLDPAFRAVALHWKRRALQAAGRDPESADVMEALLEYVPAIAVLLEEPDYNEGLFNDLGYVWVDLGMNLERATELIRRAVAADPWNAAFIDSLGWAYYKAGDFSNAQKHLARAARLRDGQDPVVYDHLADTTYRLGDRDAAARHWNKAVSLVEAETSDLGRARLADVAAAARAKLAALERSEEPVLAPTAAEQNKE